MLAAMDRSLAVNRHATQLQRTFNTLQRRWLYALPDPARQGASGAGSRSERQQPRSWRVRGFLELPGQMQ
jgi:hypothetical protein